MLFPTAVAAVAMATALIHPGPVQHGILTPPAASHHHSSISHQRPHGKRHRPAVHHRKRHLHHHHSSTTAYSTASDITDIPGVPRAFVKCVALRESNNGANAAFDGGVYGIINASGYHVNGQPISAQKAAFATIYSTTGPSAWAADGCPGT